MDWLRDWLWLVWIGIGIAAGVVEVLTLDLIFLMVAGGALLAALAAFLSGSLPISILVFAVSTVLLLLGARPPLLRYMRASAPGLTTNVAALVGRTASVVTPVSSTGGTVKLGGEVWSARADNVRLPLEIGSSVTVVRIDGATAVVAPVPRLNRGRGNGTTEG